MTLLDAPKAPNGRAGKRVGSCGWLARELGISQPRLSVLLRLPEWPFGYAPFPPEIVPRILNWLNKRRAAHPAAQRRAEIAAEELGGDGQAQAQAQAIAALKQNPEKFMRVKILAARHAQMERARLEWEGKVIERDEVERRDVRKIVAVKEKLSELPQRSALLVGKSEREIEAVIAGWIKEVCDAFAGTPAGEN
jgi:hypothetical protein